MSKITARAKLYKYIDKHIIKMYSNPRRQNNPALFAMNSADTLSRLGYQELEELGLEAYEDIWHDANRYIYDKLIEKGV